MGTRNILSLTGYMGRTNVVLLSHMVNAKKNVIYFPGDAQVRNRMYVLNAQSLTTLSVTPAHLDMAAHHI